VDFPSEGMTFTGLTDDKGQFSLRLKPGRYHLVARQCQTPFPTCQPEQIVRQSTKTVEISKGTNPLLVFTLTR
jgi:hypothetical protein